MIAADLTESLILVDETDRDLGPAPKLDTHRTGQLHRAFSIFLFAPDGGVLLQKRADVKYHSRGKWANTCCGHPRPKEPTAPAAQRRLHEELGLTADLEFGFLARYRAELDNNMIENEVAHVYFGLVQGPPRPNPDEVSETCVIPIDQLVRDIAVDPTPYSAWLVHYIRTHEPEIRAAEQRLVLAGSTDRRAS